MKLNDYQASVLDLVREYPDTDKADQLISGLPEGPVRKFIEAERDEALARRR